MIAMVPAARVWRGMFWLLAAVIAVLSLLPGQDAVPLGAYDKLAHASAYTAMAAAGALGVRSRVGLWGVIAFCALYGGAIELLQILVPQRSCEFLDFVADSVGAFVGAALAVPLRPWLSRDAAAPYTRP